MVEDVGNFIADPGAAMTIGGERREHITFALIRRMFEPEEHSVEDVQPLGDRFVTIALAIAGSAILLYSLYFGILAR